MSLAALACTGDPLLDQLLAGCMSFRLVSQPACERAADVLSLLAAEPPPLVFVSPALHDVGALAQVKGLRLCWLAEGSETEGRGPAPPEGAEVLQSERLTPQQIDAWVRRTQRPVRQAPPPPPRRPLPPPAPQVLETEPSDAAPQVPGPEPSPAGLQVRGPVPPAAGPGPGGPGRPPAVPGAGRTPSAPPPAPRVTPPPPSIRTQPPQAPMPSTLPPPPPAASPLTPRPNTFPPAMPSPPAARSPGAGRMRPQPSGSRPPAQRPAIRVLRQQVVALWGGKPGAGRSTIALGLADLLARSDDLRVCTVDLNPYNSSLAPLLGREQEVPSWVHVAEAMARGQRLPGEGLHWIRPNWALVSGPDGRPDLVAQVTPEAIAWLVDGLRSHFDYIILDPEARPGPVRDAAARLAQLVLVTVTPDYPDVLDTARGFESAVAKGTLARDRCRLVLTRWLETPHLTQAEVADCFGLPVTATIPLSPEPVLRAAGQGQPVTRLADPGAARLIQALEQLLGVVAPVLAAAGPEQARSGPGNQWFAWLGR